MCDFSIITICRNSAATIGATIESVIGQRVTEITLQYIIIDGGSTDGTMDIVRSYGTRISKIISEPDNGISDAFNKGIALADGKIIGMINSDDILLPGTLENVAHYFRLYPNTEVLHADLFLYDGKRFLKRLKPPRYWWVPWRMILFNHPTTFVRREVYLKCGDFDTSYRFSHMDFELFLRWMKAGIVIRYIPEVLVRMQSGGMSGRHIYQGFSENVRALKTHGFSQPLMYIQFLSKHIAQRILDCKDRLTRGSYKI